MNAPFSPQPRASIVLSLFCTLLFSSLSACKSSDPGYKQVDASTKTPAKDGGGTKDDGGTVVEIADLKAAEVVDLEVAPLPDLAPTADASAPPDLEPGHD